MNPVHTVEELNHTGLFAFKSIYAKLAGQELPVVAGTWRATFTGPGWLRATAPGGLALLRFGGWWGKELLSDGSGFNLFDRGGRRMKAFPMAVQPGNSQLDGQPCQIVNYGSEAGFPWARVNDELRTLAEDTIFGMTIFNYPGLRGLPIPFLLQRFS
jgi:hypothetical protein